MLFVKPYILVRKLITRAFKHDRVKMKNIAVMPPRKIWMYWAQGLEQAPELVHICLRTWQEQNPNWELTLITDETLGDYIDTSRFGPDTSRIVISDVLRIHLLRDRGGVWADATSYCMKPLDMWLPLLMQAGFFAFHRPVKARMMGNWFMASEPGGVIVSRFAETMDAYWDGREKAGDYFWFHYLFEMKVLFDRTFRKEWNRMPKVSADACHQVWRVLRKNGDPDNLPAYFDLDLAPIQKLSWKDGIEMDSLKKIGLV